MAPRIQHIPATLVYIGLLLCCRWCRSVRAKAEETTTSTFLRRTFEKDDGDGDGENGVRKYEILSSREIRDRLLQMADQYPTLVKLTTAQEEYGLPAAGTAADCTFDYDVNGCLNYIVTLQDFVTHPEGSDTSNRLPEVLLSGEVHGNERVGSTAAIETAALLLEATSCIAYPRLEVKSDPDEWQNDLELAAACRKHAFDVYGLDESNLQWLARLVTTRRVVIVPTANALGYDRNVRTEDGIDPNRDFAYDQEPELCMQTIAARTLNEVFREHMFQMSLTFHGGIELIGYEWGNLDKIDSPISPDDVAQSLIAASYSQFGGGWTQSPEYEYGPMNSILYPVYGGMEDWAYAASWDNSLAVKCQPTTYGGYVSKVVILFSTSRLAAE
jgi:Zinc carboxypeptidase